MKRKKIVRLIKDARNRMDGVAEAMPFDKGCDDPASVTFVSAEEVRAMQSALAVVEGMLEGDDFHYGGQLALSIIMTHHSAKITRREARTVPQGSGGAGPAEPSSDGGTADE